MYEELLETIISLIVVAVYIAFWRICHQKHYFRKRERMLVMVGFAMICLSTLIDITDTWGWRKNVFCNRSRYSSRVKRG